MNGHKLTIPEAAKHFSVTERTIRRWIQSSDIESTRIGRRTFVVVDSDVDISENATDTSEIVTDRNGHGTDTAALERLLQEKDARIAHLESQLERRDEQVDHLTQVVAMSQKNIGALTEQLDDSRQMIEDMRQRRTVWQRLKAVFVAESG